MALYHSGTMSPTARTRIYSCVSCQTCKNQCPEGLDPSLGLSLAMAILQEKGEPTPRGLSFLLPERDFNLMKAIEAIQLKPEERPWVTDVVRQKPSSSKTVLFTGCTGLMQPDLVSTALDLIRRVDASAQALGGIDWQRPYPESRSSKWKTVQRMLFAVVDLPWLRWASPARTFVPDV